MIPKEVYRNFQRTVIHMTDLPFGRRGSPLQDLISRRIYETTISAIKVAEGIDAGDIYCKDSLKQYKLLLPDGELLWDGNVLKLLN